MKKLLLILLWSAVWGTMFASEDWTHYTSVGNLGLTVTNLGIIGHGYNWDLQNQPSCKYKLHSDYEYQQVELMATGGLWVGGIMHDSIRVTTGALDGNHWEDREWNPLPGDVDLEGVIHTRSSIITSADYDPDAVSQQDFLCAFTDTSRYRIPPRETYLTHHNPLGLKVLQSSYVWNYPFADAFVILRNRIININTDPADTIHAVYVGYWLDEAVGNFYYTNYYQSGGGWNWYDNMAGVAVTNGLSTAQGDTIWMPLGYDADGDNGYSEAMVGLRFLGAEGPDVDQEAVERYFQMWTWKGNHSEAPFDMPQDDVGRYEAMHSREDITNPGFPYPNDQNNPDADDSWMFLGSAGPFGDLAPGDTLEVVFALVAGFWAPIVNPAAEHWDLLQQRARNLVLNSEWAQIAYNGEDANGNHQLDPGEDLIPNGRLDRYLLPEPPPAPELELVVGNHRVAIYWNDLPESAVDPIQGEQDFEGYRLYSSPRLPREGVEATLLAQFDLVDELPPNTGLEAVRLAQDTLIDGRSFQYRFDVEDLPNGFPEGNWFAVSAYDRGNPENNLPSFESNYRENWKFAFPGTVPNQDPPFVFPNPYRTGTAWDGNGPYERLLWFANLPEVCQIRVFTLGGDLVKVINHNAGTYAGGDYARFGELAGEAGGEAGVGDERFVFSGGAHPWNLVSRHNQEIATGLYLFTVKDERTGRVDTGKFLVIK